MSADSIEKVTHFRTPDGALHETISEASKHWTVVSLRGWLEARMPANEVPSFMQQLLDDWTISPRRGGV